MCEPRRRTLKVKHFFLLSDSAAKCPVFALEVYVYLSFDHATLHQNIFVPKADTSGLSLHRINAGGVVQCLLRRVLSINPALYLQGASWLTESPVDSKTPAETLRHVATLMAQDASYKPACYGGEKLSLLAQKAQLPENQLSLKVHTSISLFTRSADAYIFPSSEKNASKHVADGNSLFRWWIRNLDSVLDESWTCHADIPGSDARSIDRTLAGFPRWRRGNIYVDETSSASAIRHIPLFPDDPKGRFLEHLLVENRLKTVTSSQFWNELGFRQEFRLGNVVGIIGCTKHEDEPFSLDAGDPLQFVTLKTYKRIVGIIKGEDYSCEGDVIDMMTDGVPEMCRRCGLRYEPEEIIGTMEPRASGNSEAKRPAVNVLGGMAVKKKKKA